MWSKFSSRHIFYALRVKIQNEVGMMPEPYIKRKKTTRRVVFFVFALNKFNRIQVPQPQNRQSLTNHL